MNIIINTPPTTELQPINFHFPNNDSIIGNLYQILPFSKRYAWLFPTKESCKRGKNAKVIHSDFVKQMKVIVLDWVKYTGEYSAYIFCILYKNKIYYLSTIDDELLTFKFVL